MESFLTPYGLSNSGKEKLQFTPFLGGPKPVCSDGLHAGTIESHNFFALGPILVKFYIRTSLIKSFPTMNGLSKVRQGKVVVHTFLGWSQAGLLRQRSHRNYRKP